MEELVGRRVGEGDQPMLLRLVPSAPITASGLPPQVPGIGLTPSNAKALMDLIGREGDLYETWTSVLRLVAEDALDVSPDDIDDALEGVSAPQAQVEALLAVCATEGSGPVPEDAAEQLALAARRCCTAGARPAAAGPAAPRSCRRTWAWPCTCRRCTSGRGSAAASGRRPAATPRPAPWPRPGTFHRGVRRSALPADASGEPLSALPGGTDLLKHTLATLEHHLRDVAQVVFELRDGKLSLLSAAALDRPSPRAGLRLAVDLATAGTIDRKAALRMVRPQTVQELLHAQLRLTGSETLLAPGPGRVARGRRRPGRPVRRSAPWSWRRAACRPC